MARIFTFSGDILRTPKPWNIVIPTNTKGIFGAGLAKQAAYRHELHKSISDWNTSVRREACWAYAKECHRGFIDPGTWVYYPEFPGVSFLSTKKDWRDDARYEWITDGLYDLIEGAEEYNLKHFAVPVLGAGCGSLQREECIKTIRQAMGLAHDISFAFFEDEYCEGDPILTNYSGDEEECATQIEQLANANLEETGPGLGGSEVQGAPNEGSKDEGGKQE